MLSVLILSLIFFTPLFFLFKTQARPDGILVPRERLVVWEGSSTYFPGESYRADTRFELMNEGGKPVRVLSVESGCGCAKPVVRPELIAPGQTATVEVSALASPVEDRIVPITIHTDSPIQPDVELTLRVVGTREPPFLYQFLGDLTFRGEYSAAQNREITVVTVEPYELSKIPDLSTTLSFLKFEDVGLEEAPYKRPGILLRKRKYRVEFAERPPSGTFAGSVIVEDPWTPGITLAINVLGQFRSGLTASPSTVTLDPARQTQAKLVVFSREPIDQLHLEVDQAPGIPLDVHQEAAQEPKSVHVVTIRFEDPWPSRSGRTRVFVRRPDSSEEIVVPVSVVVDSAIPTSDREVKPDAALEE